MKNGLMIAAVVSSMSMTLASMAAAKSTQPNESVTLNHKTAQQVGRGQVKWLNDQQVQIKDAYVLASDSDLQDFTFSFEGRAPQDAPADQVGIWAVFRQFDRNHRYMVGLRGPPHSDIYLVRYSPDGEDRMLALETVPTAVPGQWYKLKVEAFGSEIKIYLNDKEVAAVEDKAASFSSGFSQ